MIVEGESGKLVLTRCPACGHEFGRDVEQVSKSRSSHIAGHAPEDFGLSPLGETDAAAQRGGALAD